MSLSNPGDPPAAPRKLRQFAGDIHGVSADGRQRMLARTHFSLARLILSRKSGPACIRALGFDVESIRPARTCPWQRRTCPWSLPRNPDPCRRSGPCRHGCRPCRRSGPCKRWRQRNDLRRPRRSSRHGRASQEQGGGSGGNGSARLEVIFMTSPPKGSWQRCNDCKPRRNFPTSSLHPAIATVRSILVTRPLKIYFISVQTSVEPKRPGTEAEPPLRQFGTINP